MKPSSLPFQTLCSFLNVVSEKSKTLKHKHLRHFREKFIERTSDDVFSIYRLMAPALDRERSNYGLKEANLVRFLIKACLLDPKTSTAAQRAENWRQAGIKNAGHFSKVMEEYLFKACCGRQPGTPEEMKLTIGQLNHYLDQLAGDVGNDGKVNVLTQLLQVTTPNQMKWIIQILLKDLKIGLSETSVLKDYHKDALDRYNVTCDFPKVIRELVDPHKRFPFQDITVGNPAKAQLARAVRSPEEAFNLMKGKFFVVETKFDGERMQVHVMPEEGQEVRYYSRRAIEHGEHSSYTVLDKFVTKQLKERGVILDAEVVVWNKAKKVFEPFGGMKSAVIAARDNEPGDTRLKLAGFNGDQMTSDPDYDQPLVKELELVLVVFDILYCRGQSVINQELRDRQALLRNILITAPEEGIPVSNAMTGRAVALLPGVPLMNGVPGSKLSTTLSDIQDTFEESIRVGEEGIVIKAAHSPWRCNDRGNAWLKIKPDYLQEVEIDAVIIGVRMGTGRRSGVFSEYLLALAEKPQNGASRPSTFVSFCMVGTGVNDNERKLIHERLAGNLVEQKPGTAKTVAPKCYKVTGVKKERPDFWVKDPSRSITLQILADVRTIISKTFASRHSLRFPRCTRVRWDKSPTDIQTDQELWEIIESNKGAIVGETTKSSAKKKQKRPTSKKAGSQRTQRSLVVEQFLPTSVEGVIQESSALKEALVYFVPSYNKPKHSKAELETIVARLGGKVSQNYIPRVTHIIAQNANEDTFRARQEKRDMISVDWLLECAKERRLVPLRPHHFLNLTKKTLEEVEDVCKYGDMYYEDVAGVDISAIINHHAHMEDIDVNALAAVVASERQNGASSSAPVSGKAKKASVKEPPTDASVETIMAYVDKLLSDKGLLDHSSCLFRGCSVCVVGLPASSQAVSSEEDAELLSCARVMHATAEASREHLGPWEVNQYALQVKMYGATVSEDITASTTHVVVVPAPHSSSSGASTGQPGQLLGQLLKDHGGLPALKTLHRRLQSEQAHVVDQSWLDQSLATLGDSAAGTPPHRVPEAEHQYLSSGAADTSQQWETWPWEDNGVSSAPATSAKSKRSRASAESSEGSEEVGPAKKARRSRTSGATGTSRAASKAPAKRKAAPRKKAAPLAPPVGARQRGAGRGRGGARAKKEPDPESEDEEDAAEEADERSESPEPEADRAEAAVPMDAEPVSEGKAEHTDTLNAEQPGSSRAAEAPTTLLEELLGLPAPEYASLAAAPAQGQFQPTVLEQPTQGGIAEDMSPDRAATAAAQPGSLLEALFSMPAGKEADGNAGQQQSMVSGAGGVMPTQVQEAPQPKEATVASIEFAKQADSTGGQRLSLKERIRMLKGAGAS